MSELPKTPTYLSAVVTLRNTPQDCFFSLDCGTNWCPGWAIADIILPLAVHANQYVLVWDAVGITYWIVKHKVRFRGDIHKFDYDYYQTKFDWNKWRLFKPINESFIPSAGNVYKESDGAAVGEYFEF